MILCTIMYTWNINMRVQKQKATWSHDRTNVKEKMINNLFFFWGKSNETDIICFSVCDEDSPGLHQTGWTRRLKAAVCSSGQSQVSRIDWRPQSRSRGRWLHPPRPRASARSPSEAAARDPSSSSSSCSGGDGGRRKERLLSGSDQWRKNHLENHQIKKSVTNENKNEKKLTCSTIFRKIHYIIFLHHV